MCFRRLRATLRISWQAPGGIVGPGCKGPPPKFPPSLIHSSRFSLTPSIPNLIKKRLHVVLFLLWLRHHHWRIQQEAGRIWPIGGEDTWKLLCLARGAAAACCMPLKPTTLWFHLAILVWAPFRRKWCCCHPSASKMWQNSEFFKHQ